MAAIDPVIRARPESLKVARVFATKDVSCEIFEVSGR
jgi:hypothetical protein